MQFDVRLWCKYPENDMGDRAQDNPAEEIYVLPQISFTPVILSAG